jgi:hypothetical protein
MLFAILKLDIRRYMANLRCTPKVCWLSLCLLGSSSAVHAGDTHLVGEWSARFDWPVIAIHAALLPDGKVLAYDSVGDDATETYPQNVTQTRAALWDPKDNSFNSAELGLGYNIFCSGLGLLSNGHVFIAGGNLNTDTDKLLGINNLTDYDPFSQGDFPNRFSAVGTMNTSRWYPSITALANGEMMISGGADGPSAPEVRLPNGKVRELSDAHGTFASDRIYQWLKLAPNGHVAYVGPKPSLRYLHTEGHGGWEDTGHDRDAVDRDYGSHALYADGKVLVAGGGKPATDSAVTIDLNSMQSSPIEPMHYARRQHNLTLLPDGSVLATGGFAGTSSFYDYDTAVYAAESWDPRSQHWRVLASMAVHRAYHSIAMLLPDGRVLSAGGGICSGCNPAYLNRDAEIFSPPYLFMRDGSGRLAIRPVITSAPDEIAPGQRFNIRVSNPGTVTMVSLIRLGAVTHSTNMDQRFLALRFRQRRGGRLAVWSPADNRLAPPGYYMLFVCRRSGVPSEARILRVSGGEAISYTQ